MKVTVIRIVIGALGTIHKGLVKSQQALEIGRRAEIIQTMVLFRSARIRKLAAIQIPMKDFQLTLVWKTH